MTDDSTIAVNVGSVKVRQQASPASDHLEESATGRVVVPVLAQVTIELVDALGQERYLYLS